MRPAVRSVILAPRPFDPYSLFASYGVAGIYVPDFNPARLAASGLSRLYTTSAGVTPVAAVADTIGLAIGESQGAAIGAELIANGGFPTDATGWTSVNSPNLTFGANGVTIQNNGTSAGLIYQAFSTVVGALYKIEVDIVHGGTGFARAQIDNSAPSAIGGTIINVAASGHYVGYWIAGATTSYVLIGNRNDNNASHSFDNVSVKRIAGNAAQQATANSRGTLRQGNFNGHYVWRGDGVDDGLRSTLNLANAMTLIVGCELTAAAAKTPLGSGGGSSTRGYIGTTAAGVIGGAVGSQTPSTIVGTSNIVNVPGVAALRWNGTTVSLWWKPFNGDAAKEYEAAQSGGPHLTTPIDIGSRNFGGTSDSFFQGDIYNVLAAQASFSDGDVVAAMNSMSR